MSDAVVVRPARVDDLDALVAALGQAQYFEHRLGRQPRLGILLVAVLNGGHPDAVLNGGHPEAVLNGGQPDAAVVGSAFLRLAPAEEWELRDRMRKVPVLTHVEVVAEQRRSGVGRRIVLAAEEQARRHGRRHIALGVKDDNPAALAMYTALGYVDWGRGPINALVETFEGGDRPKISTETCDILVKGLDVARGTPMITSPDPAGRRGRRPGRPHRRR